MSFNFRHIPAYILVGIGYVIVAAIFSIAFVLIAIPSYVWAWLYESFNLKKSDR
jgi:hypothetical protein